MVMKSDIRKNLKKKNRGSPQWADEAEPVSQKACRSQKTRSKQEEFPLMFYFILGPLDFIVRLLLWQWFGPCFMTTHEVKFYRKRETHQSWLYSSFCWSANMSLKTLFIFAWSFGLSLVLFLFPFACVVVSSKSFFQSLFCRTYY